MCVCVQSFHRIKVDLGPSRKESGQFACRGPVVGNPGPNVIRAFMLDWERRMGISHVVSKNLSLHVLGNAWATSKGFMTGCISADKCNYGSHSAWAPIPNPCT